MVSKVTYIYGLSDGINIRYVGKSDYPNKRKEEHIYEVIREKKTKKDEWVNKTIENNKKIILEILEIVPVEKWEEREKYWIRYYGINNLTNRSIGGRGKNGYENFMKRTKNLKITPATHIILKKYCEENGLKMFAFVERIIKEKCDPKKDLYGEH